MLSRILCLLAVSSAALCAWAAPLQENTPPKLAFTLASKTAKPGGQLKGTIAVSLAEGLHCYQNPPSASYQIPISIVSETKGVTLKATYPKGVIRKVGGEEAAVYEGTVNIPVMFTLPEKTGKREIKISVSYQQCTETTCFPPGKSVLKSTVDVKADKPKVSKPKSGKGLAR